MIFGLTGDDLTAIQLVLAVAFSSLWLAITLTNMITCAGRGHHPAINIFWLACATIFWLAWVVQR